ncbi:hypothetical protein JCM24511_04628 [Saitozyma sp. JCM 24511]|nr:hypothetical protein JCM24511_04628 [Saitozyma sp. JCM 24511]
MASSEVISVPYIDIQHDALAVLDDVEQGTVMREDIWISGYKAGSSSVHGKARVEMQEGGGASLTPRDGVNVERTSKTNFLVSVPALQVERLPVRFPRQVIYPPYQKKTSLTPALQINSLAYSSTRHKLVVGGPDGYCALLPTGQEARVKEETVLLKGHVGDVLDVKFFPSGEVILTTSSDLSIRIFGLDGANPRTLKGHHRAPTSTAILGVGKQILSGSKDGTVRLWDIGGARELRAWSTEGRAPVEALVLLDGPAAVAELGLGVEDEWAVLAFTQAGNVEVFYPTRKAESAPGRMALGVAGQLVTVAYDPERKILATGHSSGVVSLRHLSALKDGETSPPTLIRRNESPVHSLAWAEGDLLMGTAAGLPCRLGLRENEEGKMGVAVKEELAGWDAVGVDGFAS